MPPATGTTSGLRSDGKGVKVRVLQYCSVAHGRGARAKGRPGRAAHCASVVQVLCEHPECWCMHRCKGHRGSSRLRSDTKQGQRSHMLSPATRQQLTGQGRPLAVGTCSSQGRRSGNTSRFITRTWGCNPRPHLSLGGLPPVAGTQGQASRRHGYAHCPCPHTTPSKATEVVLPGVSAFSAKHHSCRWLLSRWICDGVQARLVRASVEAVKVACQKSKSHGPITISYSLLQDSIGSRCLHVRL